MNEFSKLVSDFFIRYLTNQKNASENTIKTYRDAVVQLLEFMNSKGIKANKIKITYFFHFQLPVNYYLSQKYPNKHQH